MLGLEEIGITTFSFHGPQRQWEPLWGRSRGAEVSTITGLVPGTVLGAMHLLSTYHVLDPVSAPMINTFFTQNCSTRWYQLHFAETGIKAGGLKHRFGARTQVIWFPKSILATNVQVLQCGPGTRWNLK